MTPSSVIPRLIGDPESFFASFTRKRHWILAFAKMTEKEKQIPRFARNDKLGGIDYFISLTEAGCRRVFTHLGLTRPRLTIRLFF